MYDALLGNLDALPVWVNSLIVVAMIVVVGAGAHLVVESAAEIAKRMGISELIIGLTVVSLGTSAPEFAVTLLAAFKGQGDISVGNIVGSNIFNIGFILGGCAMVRVIPTSPTLLWRDGLVLGGTSVLLLVLVGWNNRLDHYDGVILFLLLCAYLACLYKSRHDAPETGDELDENVATRKKPLWFEGGMLLLGLACIVIGSHFLIGSATAVAHWFEISDWVIGVTIVAAGTSAPEFATSLVAVVKGRYGISAGNLIGSNIFNLLGVLGLAGILHPVEVDPMARVSLMALCGLVFIVLVFMRTGWRLSRLEGLALFLIGATMWGFELVMHS